MINKIAVKENMEIRNSFTKSHDIQLIDVSKIKLTEKIHIDANVNFSKQILKLKSKDIQVLNNPIIIKDNKDGSYSLVTGYKGYRIANELNHEVIPAIVISETRKEFINKIGFKSSHYKEMFIKNISIPELFKERRVTKIKVQKVLDYYNKHKTFDKPITITNENVLIDGYSRYVAAKILRLNKVPIVYNLQSN